MGCYLHSSQKWTRPLVIGVFSHFAIHSMLFFSDATLLTQSKTGHKGYFAVFHVKKKVGHPCCFACRDASVSGDMTHSKLVPNSSGEQQLVLSAAQLLSYSVLCSMFCTDTANMKLQHH